MLKMDMSATPRDILSLVSDLRPALLAFGKRNRVSLIEMVSLLGAVVLDIGIKLEEVAGIEDRAKTFDVPLARELMDVITGFGKRHHVSAVEMIAVLGATLIDSGASIESEVNTGTRLN
jgi:hypothetical protein